MQTTDFVSEYFSLWNHHDAKGIAELLRGDGCYFDQPKNVTLNGSQFVEHLQQLFTQTPLRYELVGEVLVGECSLAFRYKSLFAGADDQEHTRALGAEFITLDDDNNLVQIDDFYQVYNGLAVEVVNKYKKSGLSPQQSKHYKAQLHQLLEGKKLYRNPDLKMPELANELKLSANHLSQVINSEYGMTFTDFINQYRVAEAQQILSSDQAGQYSMLELGLAVGFNTNSTFYSAFKKINQLTPAQYRRKL